MQTPSFIQQQEDLVSHATYHDLWYFILHGCVHGFVCIGVQTVFERADCAVQCSLLPAPPLILLQPMDEGGRDTDSNSKTEEETEETEETEVDESEDDYLCSDETEECEG